MAWAFGIGAVVLLPVLVASAGAWLASPGGLALVLYLGALPTALAYVLFARGLQRLGAGETATLTLAEPLTAAALGDPRPRGVPHAAHGGGRRAGPRRARGPGARRGRPAPAPAAPTAVAAAGEGGPAAVAP
jgi:DME family drug/metabolite transporter